MRGRRGALAAGLSVLATPAPGRTVPRSAVPEGAVPVLSRSYLVFFDFDSCEITARGQQIVADAARVALDVRSGLVQVVGHADRAGPADYNTELSRRRVYTAAGLLRMHGWPQERTEVLWYGETRPLVPTADGVAEPQNRCAGFVHR